MKLFAAAIGQLGSVVLRRSLATQTPVVLATRARPASTPATTTKQQPRSSASSSGELRVVNPLKEADFFQLNELVKLEELFKARCHYGHNAGLRSPWMNEYIFGTRVNTDIIDLERTVPLLRRALNFVAHVAFRNGIVLFVTRTPQHVPVVERLAAEIGEYAHCRSWMRGTLTDSMRAFGTVVRLPDTIVLLSAKESLSQTHDAVTEAAKMLIPTVAICDTDTDPSLITYPVPGNDDSMASLLLYCDLFKRAVLAGKAKRKELDQQGCVYEYDVAQPPQQLQ